MSEECIIESDGTIFRFSVTNKGYNDEGYYWTNTNISVENWCFNYRTSGSCFEFSELKHMRDKLTSLLNDEVVSIKTITFLEPDVEIVLKPKCDLLNSGKYIYIKTGYEIEDISAEFLFFPFIEGVITNQHYVMQLFREDINKLVLYLNAIISKLD